MKKRCYPVMAIMICSSLLALTGCWKPGGAEGDYEAQWPADPVVKLNGTVLEYDVDLAGYIVKIPVGKETFILVIDIHDPDYTRPTPCNTTVDKVGRACLCKADMTGVCESILIDPEQWKITAPDKNAKTGVASQAKLVAGKYSKLTIDTTDVREASPGVKQVSRLVFEDPAIGLGGKNGFWTVSWANQKRTIHLEGTPGTQDWATSADPAYPSNYSGRIGFAVGFLNQTITGLELTYERTFSLDKI